MSNQEVVKPGGVAAQAHVVFRYSTAAKVKAPWRTSSHLSGSHRSDHLGKSGIRERQTRKYRPGDNPRRIKWKKLARQPEKTPLVRLFDAHKKIPVVLLMDISSPDYGTQAVTKRMLAAALMCSAIRSAGRMSDMVKVVFFSRGRAEKAFPRASGELAVAAKVRARSIKTALTLEPAPAADEAEQLKGFVPGLHEALTLLPENKSLVFIISDFSGYEAIGPEECALLRRVSHRHEVICLKVNDLREWNLHDIQPSFLPVTVQPAEGPAQVVWNRKRYQQQFLDAEVAIGGVFSSLGWKAAKFGTEESAQSVRKRFRRIISGKRGKRRLSLSSSTQEGGK